MLRSDYPEILIKGVEKTLSAVNSILEEGIIELGLEESKQKRARE